MMRYARSNTVCKQLHGPLAWIEWFDRVYLNELTWICVAFEASASRNDERCETLQRQVYQHLSTRKS
jgi:hypothetical protein